MVFYHQIFHKVVKQLQENLKKIKKEDMELLLERDKHKIKVKMRDKKEDK